MSDEGLTVLDGSDLRSIDLSISSSDGSITGAEVLELAASRASLSLLGLALPEYLKSSALHRLNLDPLSFPSTELHIDQASSTLKDYVTTLADELKDDPLVVVILDGKTLRLFLEDEDDFALLAENIFTDLDPEEKGKISKNEIRSALLHMGVEMGVPPFSEFPELIDILKKHGADGEEQLGQAQFAQLLQHVLQELADALAQKHVVAIQNIQISNGSKLRKFLANKNLLDDVVQKIMHEKHHGKDERRNTEIIRGFLEINGKELGLPPLKGNEVVALLYDEVFSDVDNRKSAAVSERDEFMVLVKGILDKFAEQLEANPIFHDPDN